MRRINYDKGQTSRRKDKIIKRVKGRWRKKGNNKGRK
jgi:hypothetical protein